MKGKIALAVITLPIKLWLSPADLIKGNNLSSYSFLTCLELVLLSPFKVILDFSFISNGRSLDNNRTIGYSGGYIVIVFRDINLP